MKQNAESEASFLGGNCLMSYFHLKSKPTMPLVYILDRHHVWRSLDPTLDTWSNFVKKAFCLLFCLFI